MSRFAELVNRIELHCRAVGSELELTLTPAADAAATHIGITLLDRPFTGMTDAFIQLAGEPVTCVITPRIALSPGATVRFALTSADAYQERECRLA
jgi:hypothetical protein